MYSFVYVDFCLEFRPEFGSFTGEVIPDGAVKRGQVGHCFDKHFWATKADQMRQHGVHITRPFPDTSNCNTVFIFVAANI